MTHSGEPGYRAPGDESRRPVWKRWLVGVLIFIGLWLAIGIVWSVAAALLASDMDEESRAVGFIALFVAGLGTWLIMRRRRSS
jgi:uncharacterized membrane-anchored protein